MMRTTVAVLVAVACIGVCAAGVTLSGSWIGKLTIDPQMSSFTGAMTLANTLIMQFGIEGWVFGSSTTLDKTGWTNQVFTAAGVFGAIGVSSSLDLDPDGKFDRASLTMDMSIAGARYVSTFTSTPNDLALTMTAAAESDAIALDVTVQLGDTTVAGCDLLFQQVAIGLDFTFCCGVVASNVYFDCSGFKKMDFGVNGIAIPAIPWMTLAAKLEFSIQTGYDKQLTITPTFNYGSSICFDLYFDTVEDAGETWPFDTFVFSEIRVVGIGLECVIRGIAFSSISYWGTGGAPAPLFGNYWEAYQISTTSGGNGCCGPFGFAVAAFFLEDATTLFEVGLFRADFSLGIGAFTASVGVDVDVAGVGFTEMRVGLEVKF